MTNDIQTGRQAGSAATQQQQQQAPHMVPPVDVYEDEAGITVLADLPGVSRERLAVRIDGDTLLIEGTAQVNGPANLELLYGEAQPATYRREFTLSRELDPSRVDAQLKDGVLRLSIPKAEDAKPRRIEVQVG
jgi:HSP20 family protein